MLVNPLGSFFIVFTLSLSISLLVTPITVRLGYRLGVVDSPGGRRKGHGDVSRLGGIAIYLSFMIAVLTAQFLPVPRFDPKEVIRFMGLIVGGTFIFGMGLLDDVRQFGPIPQAVSQLVAAIIAIAFLIFIETVNNPLTGNQVEWNFLLTVVFTVGWLGVMMNTVNFLDGLDGLASGVSVIAGLMLFINSAFRIVPAQTSVSLLPLALIGSCLGFLIYNFHPAKVFMGSGGSYFLGYVLGTMSIIGGAKMATILLVMGLPLLDAVWLVFNRVFQGRNPMQGDRGHLHFRLVDMGFSQRRIVLLYYLFCGFFGVLTLVTNSRLFKLVALLIMIGLVFLVLFALKRLEMRRLSAESA